MNKENTSITRINKLLCYIQENIDQPLSLECLAKQCFWSRWQLQRVFQHYTGASVAQYVREQKLSGAAIEVLAKKKRMLDIAHSFGFNSEIAFSRAFKKHFNCSPRSYQKQGEKRGIKSAFINMHSSPFKSEHSFLQVRLEYKPSFTIVGLPTTISGVLSETPNFQDKIPPLWYQLEQFLPENKALHFPKIGAIDTRQDDPDKITYWAGGKNQSPCFAQLIKKTTQAKLLTIPAQQYAVMAFSGLPNAFSKAIEWFICEGLPEPNYAIIEGFEIEVYHSAGHDLYQPIEAEYWLPISSS